MSKGINKVILIGNLGADPEIRYTQAGVAAANFSVATTDTRKDKQGQKQDRTEWHRVVVFSNNAEFAGQYLKKGSKVYIEGSMRTTKYTDKHQIERYATEVVGESLQALDSNNKQQQHPQQSCNRLDDVPF